MVDIRNKIVAGSVVALVNRDISAAFDMVNHRTLKTSGVSRDLCLVLSCSPRLYRRSVVSSTALKFDVAVMPMIRSYADDTQLCR